MMERVPEGVVSVKGVTSHGTGFIFEIRGTTALILTANHLVGEGASVDVTVEDKGTFRAKVVGSHETLDTAVLSICCDKFTDLPWRTLLTDDDGWVISIKRSDPTREAEFEVGRVRGRKSYSDGDAIFHDSGIGPGYSGSPLLVNGRVVGMTIGGTAEKGFEDLAMALAAHTIRVVAEDLIEGVKVTD